MFLIYLHVYVLLTIASIVLKKHYSIDVEDPYGCLASNIFLVLHGVKYVENRRLYVLPNSEILKSGKEIKEHQC